MCVGVETCVHGCVAFIYNYVNVYVCMLCTYDVYIFSTQYSLFITTLLSHCSRCNSHSPLLKWLGMLRACLITRPCYPGGYNNLSTKSPKEKMVICALLYIRIDYLTLLTVVTVLVTMVHWSTMTTAWNQLTLINVIHACQLVCPHVYM